MKLMFVLSACISLFGLSAGSAFANDLLTSCSLETLHGTMGWSGIGQKNGAPYSGSGMESYDGQGHLKYYTLRSDGITQSKYVGTGTYTITANCIATVIYDGAVAEPWTYFVAPDGSVFYYNNNLGTGAIGAGQENRISKALLVQ
jgi:hypothetical protein